MNRESLYYTTSHVKRGKNDAADAEALCEAAGRPTMRYVTVKTAEQQSALILAGSRERLVRQRVQLTNAIRGLAAEFGLVAAKGTSHIMPLLARIDDDATVPALAREMFDGLRSDYEHVETRISEVDAKLRSWHRANEASQRLARAPGLGPVIASLLVMKTPDPAAFRSGARLRGLARVDAQGPLDRRQDPAGPDHPGGGRDAAKLAGGGCHGGDLEDALGRREAPDALAAEAARAQAAEARALLDQVDS